MRALAQSGLVGRASPSQPITVHRIASFPSLPCHPRQSFEGGLGGEPWNEAHGGYTFCGLAALVLLGRGGELDVPRLLRWAAQCQVGGRQRGSRCGRPPASVRCSCNSRAGALILRQSGRGLGLLAAVV